MGLVSRPETWRLHLLALVRRMGLAYPTPAHRIQRSNDYVSAGDGVANPRRVPEDVLLRMGRTVARRHRLPRRLVGQHGWRSLWQRPHLLRDQTRCGRWHRGPTVLHALFILRFRPA